MYFRNYNNLGLKLSFLSLENLELLETWYKNPISPIKPLGGLFLILDTREGGLLERGTYSQSQVTRTYLEAFLLFHPIFCGINKQFYGSDT